jgi:hypothetical protein
MSEYSEKLRDPRWQKKRLEIMERDGWACQNCFDTESTLCVHHKYYLKDKEIWEYPNRLLITLCENCHEIETVNQTKLDGYFLDELHTLFLSASINEIYIGLCNLETVNGYAVTAEVLGWVMQNQEIMKELNDKYFAHLHKIALNKHTQIATRGK